MNCAILVIDMQNDFVEEGGVLCVAVARATVPTIQKLISHGRTKNWHIIHIIREHHFSGCDVDKPRKVLFEGGKKGYCVPGTWGHKIIAELTPKEDDIIIKKRRNSGFFQTNLDSVLRRLCVQTVIIAGTQYPNCIRGTAVDAMSYDYRSIVCTDACSAQSEQIATANIYDMQNMGIECVPLSKILEMA